MSDKKPCDRCGQSGIFGIGFIPAKITVESGWAGYRGMTTQSNWMVCGECEIKMHEMARIKKREEGEP